MESGKWKKLSKMKAPPNWKNFHFFYWTLPLRVLKMRTFIDFKEAQSRDYRESALHWIWVPLITMIAEKRDPWYLLITVNSTPPRFSNQATGVKKSLHFMSNKNAKMPHFLFYLGFARPFAPIGPRAGSTKWLSYTSKTYLRIETSNAVQTERSACHASHPRDGPQTFTLNFIPCWITQISLGRTNILGNIIRELDKTNLSIKL